MKPIFNPQKLLKTAFNLHPESELIIFEGLRLTRRQVFENIQALAGALQSLGVHVGERVVGLLPACPESIYTLFLPEMLGTVHVPLNPMFSERELLHILKDCGASVVVTCQRLYGRDFPSMLERMLPELPGLRIVVVVDAEMAGGPVFFGMQELLARRKPLELPRLDPSAVAVITYTSGTTGLPKGVMHSLPRLFSLVRPGLDLRLARCMLLPFPLYQIGGMIGVVGPLISGGKIVLMERFDPQRMLESIQNERVTQVAGSPTMYRLMLAHPAISRFDLSSLRRVTYGSEPCPAELARAIHERFRCGLENIYATTESLIISWTNPRDGLETVANTVGKPVAGVRLRIVDDLRQPVQAGTPGEVAVKSSMMMLGYYNDPELTAQVLDPQDWFYTGDIGVLGQDGYLRLVDRKKDVIIRGGQKIFPAEVEQWLASHPQVRRAAVVGIPHPLIGEAVWAFIEKQPGAELTGRQVLDHCRGQIASFKIPEQVRFMDHLPTTAVGKIQKFRLRELALQELQHE